MDITEDSVTSTSEEKIVQCSGMYDTCVFPKLNIFSAGYCTIMATYCVSFQQGLFVCQKRASFCHPLSNTTILYTKKSLPH
jgi:hypothetical protein